ncbi:MAG: hypothetical protein AB7I08_02770 [Thermoleophilia bacterium]
MTPARESTTARGYGWVHQQVRARWAVSVATGRVCCARCGLPIEPGEPWDLGHDDHDRTRYSGPEHRACNRATAGRRGEPVSYPLARESPRSRDW